MSKYKSIIKHHLHNVNFLTVIFKVFSQSMLSNKKSLLIKLTKLVLLNIKFYSKVLVIKWMKGRKLKRIYSTHQEKVI